MITAQQKTLKSNFCYIRDIFKTTLDDFLNLQKRTHLLKKMVTWLVSYNYTLFQPNSTFKRYTIFYQSDMKFENQKRCMTVSELDHVAVLKLAWTTVWDLQFSLNGLRHKFSHKLQFNVTYAMTEGDISYMLLGVFYKHVWSSLYLGKFKWRLILV